MLKPNDKHFLYTFVPVLELIKEDYFPGNNLEQYQSNVPRETYKKKI